MHTQYITVEKKKIREIITFSAFFFVFFLNKKEFCLLSNRKLNSGLALKIACLSADYQFIVFLFYLNISKQKHFL